MPQLQVLSRYRARGVVYEPGQVLDLTEAQAAALEIDSPGTFQRVEAELVIKAPGGPPVDKAVRAAPVKKGAKGAEESPPQDDDQPPAGDGAAQP